MPKLEPPDTHYLSAAVGWYELGNLAEAESELELISSPRRNHPDVLEVRWMLLARANRWDEGVKVAEDLVRAAPRRSSGWLHRAYALRRAGNGGLQQAWDALLPAAGKFPRESTIPYNLSCYACQMGRLDEARSWLRQALAVGGEKKVRAMALQDEDLKPLWPELAQP
jgi:Flp pilus assembly protein TadD